MIRVWHSVLGFARMPRRITIALPCGNIPPIQFAIRVHGQISLTLSLTTRVAL